MDTRNGPAEKTSLSPAFYLRGFSGNGKQIFRIEKAKARGCLCSINDAAAIRDYHELDYENAEDPHALEKRLADIEGQLAAALAQIIGSGIKSDVAHARLVEFVSLMRVRVPAFKQYIEETLRQLVRSTGKIMECKGKLPPTPKGLENIFTRDGVSISISNWKCLEFMFGLASDQEILRLFASMTPSVLHAPEGTALSTCDQPVAVFHPDADPSTPYGTGLPILAHRFHCHCLVEFYSCLPGTQTCLVSDCCPQQKSTNSTGERW
jgi:hypothetical protein